MWLQQLLTRVRPDRVLVICAHAQTASALEHLFDLVQPLIAQGF